MCKKGLQLSCGDPISSFVHIPYPCIQDFSIHVGKNVVFFKVGEGYRYGKGFIFCKTSAAQTIYLLFKKRCLNIEAQNAQLTEAKQRMRQELALPLVPAEKNWRNVGKP